MKPLLVYDKNHQGQALVSLLMFILVAMTVVTSIVVIVIGNNQAANESQQGDIAYSVAESGAENALMRLIRDPNYSGETMTIGSGSAVITVTGTTTKTIVSQGQVNNLIRKIQVVTSYNNSQTTINSWKEIQ